MDILNEGTIASNLTVVAVLVVSAASRDQDVV